MGWLGKLVGGTLGFFVGGPLGAIAGAALGHGFDVYGEAGNRGNDDSLRRFLCPNCRTELGLPGPGHYRCEHCGHEFVYRGITVDSGIDYAEQSQMAFFVTTFSLLGKMAKADGVVTQKEIDLIDRFITDTLHLDVEARKIAIRIFNEAKSSTVSFDELAQQFHELFHDRREILITMIEVLLQIASSDTMLHPGEEDLIRRAVLVFRITDTEFRQLKAKYFDEHDRYYAILNCSPQCPDDEIKKNYRRLAQDYHPDKIIGKGLPQEFVDLAHKKFREIQEAYEELKKQRGFV